MRPKGTARSPSSPPRGRWTQVNAELPRRWLARGGIALLGVIISIGLGWLVFRGTEWATVAATLRGFPPVLLVVAVILFLCAAYLRAMRWSLLWTREKVTTFRLFMVENAALGANSISPVRTVDEAVEFVVLALRDRLPAGSIIATMVMNRLLDLAVTLMFLVFAAVILPPLQQFLPAMVLVSVSVGILLLGLLNLGRIVQRLPRLRRFTVVASFESAVNALWTQKLRMGASLGLTAAHWLALGPVGWVIAGGVGIDVGFHQVMATIIGSILFSTIVPGLPAAVGTFEFAAVYMLELWGVPRESAVTFAIILHAILYVPPTIIAIALLPREGLGSLHAFRDAVRSWHHMRQTQDHSFPGSRDHEQG